MTIIIPTFLLLLFLALGLPIAFSLGISGAIGLLMVGGWDSLIGILSTTPVSTVANYLFTTIPMFILMAEFMTAGNYTRDVYTAARRWIGHYPGGLGIATVLAGTGLGAVSGSSTASAATLSTISHPEMKKYGYPSYFSISVSSVTGTLSILIPPSVGLILYGVLTETPINLLFLAGVFPGIITALGYIIAIMIISKTSKEKLPQLDKSNNKQRFLSLLKIWPIILISIIVLGSIYTGVITVTEAGGLGAFIAFLISLIMGRLTWKKFSLAIERTLKISTMIFFIIIGAMIFGYYLTLTQAAQKTVTFIGQLDISNWMILVLILIVYLLLGMFLDQLSVVILTIPLTFPLIISLGFDPIWFGIILVKVAEIGLVTPPVGMNIFVAAGAVNEEPSIAFKGITWFVIMDLLIIGLLLLFPGIVFILT